MSSELSLSQLLRRQIGRRVQMGTSGQTSGLRAVLRKSRRPWRPAAQCAATPPSFMSFRAVKDFVASWPCWTQLSEGSRSAETMWQDDVSEADVLVSPRDTALYHERRCLWSVRIALQNQKMKNGQRLTSARAEAQYPGARCGTMSPLADTHNRCS